MTTDLEELRNAEKAAEKDADYAIMREKSHMQNVIDALNKLGTKMGNESKIKSVIEELRMISGVHCEKGSAVIYYKRRSQGCKDCNKDLGCTVRISRKCNRNCFFCFAGEKPAKIREKVNIKEIKAKVKKRMKEVNFKSFAISGGEPLLYLEEMFEILSEIKKSKRKMHIRIYTNGDLMTEKILKRLASLGVDEIRYSIKPFEFPNTRLINVSKKHIKTVIIEIPIIPGNLSYFKKLISKIEKTRADGINLLELFFNGVNVAGFKKRRLKIDLNPGKIRGLFSQKPVFEYPVYGSKLACLKLMLFFARKKTRLFINFCSQATKDLQYLEKAKRQSIKNNRAYYTQGRQGEHNFLALYSDFNEAKKIIKDNKLGKYSVTKSDSGKERLETSLMNRKYFLKKRFVPVKVIRDPNNQYDIKLERLTNPRL